MSAYGMDGRNFYVDWRGNWRHAGTGLKVFNPAIIIELDARYPDARKADR